MKAARSAAAFTLFEIVVVVAIFALLAGGIYATVSAALRATAVLSEENTEQQRLDALVNLLRRTFHNLPATAILSGGVRVQDGDGVPEIILREAPGAFSWGLAAPADSTILLGIRPRVGGGKELSLLQLAGSLTELERRDALAGGGKWLKLLPDLRSAGWRFYDPNQQDWVEEWPEGAERPPLVELSLEMLGEETARRYVFWLPPVRPYQPPAAPAAGGGTNIEVQAPQPGPTPAP
jgi:prepilin-type N-terminal cleavage/methylation domain-containing protein